jgi:hypothetical protein
LKGLGIAQHGSYFFMQKIARIRLRSRQASPACEGNRCVAYAERGPDTFERLNSLRCRGGTEKLTEHNTLAFPVSFFEGQVLRAACASPRSFHFDAFLPCFYSLASQSRQHAVQALLKV